MSLPRGASVWEIPYHPPSHAICGHTYKAQFVCLGELKFILLSLPHIQLIICSLPCELSLSSIDMNYPITSRLCSNLQTCHFLAQFKTNACKLCKGALDTLLLWEYPETLQAYVVCSGMLATFFWLCSLPLAWALCSGFTRGHPLWPGGQRIRFI